MSNTLNKISRSGSQRREPLLLDRLDSLVCRLGSRFLTDARQEETFLKLLA